MAAIGLMRSDRLSAPPISCLLFALSFLSGGAVFPCQTRAPKHRCSHLMGLTVFKPKWHECEMLDAAGECFSLLSDSDVGFWWVLFCGLLFFVLFCFVLQRQLHAGWVVLVWRVKCNSGFLYFMCPLCFFLLIWDLTLGTLQRTISTFITKTKTRYR